MRYTTPAAAAPMSPGWSNAARSRATQTSHRTTHPLGERIGAGSGYTLYRDDMNGGTVQIWDES